MSAIETYNWMHTHWFMWMVEFCGLFFFAVAVVGSLIGFAAKDLSMSRWYIAISAAAFLFFVGLNVVLHFIGID